MTIRELHNRLLLEEAPTYDARLGVAMTEEQYAGYLTNYGHTYYVYLHKLVRRLRPRKILELGTSIGRSGLFMMTALPKDSQLVTVDIGSYLRTDLAEFAFDSRLKIIFGNDLDQDVFNQVGSGFDLFFIDSEHSFDQVNAEWDKYQHLLTDEAIVVMDDINLNEGMKQFWNSLPYDKVDTGSGLHFSGFGLFAYRR